MKTKIENFITNYADYNKVCNLKTSGVVVLEGRKENSKYVLTSTVNLSNALQCLRYNVEKGEVFSNAEDMHRTKISELYLCPKEEVEDLKNRLIVKHDTIRNGHNNVYRPVIKGIKERLPVNLESLVAYRTGKKNTIHRIENVFDNVSKIAAIPKQVKKAAQKLAPEKPLNIDESIKTIRIEHKDLAKKIRDLKELESLLTKKADLLEAYSKAEKDYLNLCETIPSIKNELLS